MYSHFTPSIPGIGSRFILTLTRIMCINKEMGGDSIYGTLMGKDMGCQECSYPVVIFF